MNLGLLVLLVLSRGVVVWISVKGLMMFMLKWLRVLDVDVLRILVLFWLMLVLVMMMFKELMFFLWRLVIVLVVFVLIVEFSLMIISFVLGFLGRLLSVLIVGCEGLWIVVMMVVEGFCKICCMKFLLMLWLVLVIRYFEGVFILKGEWVWYIIELSWMMK